MRKGFTLIELAIALMVIGLILAMAMKGRAIVDAANIKADMNKMNKMTSAIMTYVSIYNRLPGTVPLRGGGTVGTSQAFYIDMIDELFLDRPDFLAQSESGETYFKVVSCQVRASGGYDISTTLKTYGNLCMILSTQHPAHGNTATIKASNKFACYMEELLDNKNLTSGAGRSRDMKNDPFPSDDTNCDDAGAVTNYAYLVY